MNQTASRIVSLVGHRDDVVMPRTFVNRHGE